VIPPSRHSDTGLPYQWTTSRTLLNTPLADLPVFTREHFGAMEDVLRQFGWDAPTLRQRSVPVDRPARSQVSASGEIAFDVAVRNARLQWLPLLVAPNGLHDL
jgi:hypothetical protein